MLTAYLDSKHVMASDVTDRKANYVDEIGQKMILVKGNIVIHHFRHVPNEYSLYNNEPESKEHSEGKQFIYDSLHGEKDLEYIFSDIKRRADVVSHSKKIVFEIQCSAISPDEIDARNSDYRTIGYSVMWIFTGKRYKKDGNVDSYSLKKSEAHVNNICGSLLILDKDYVLQIKFKNVKNRKTIRTLRRVHSFQQSIFYDCIVSGKLEYATPKKSYWRLFENGRMFQQH